MMISRFSRTKRAVFYHYHHKVISISAALLFFLLMPLVFGWADTSVGVRRPINCTNIPPGMPTLVNGSNGIPATFTPCAPGLYFYGNASAYFIGNDTARLPFDTDNSTQAPYNASDVWLNQSLVILQLGSLNASAGVQPIKGSNFGGFIATGCKSGACLDFTNDSDGDYLRYSSALIPNYTNTAKYTYMMWIKQASYTYRMFYSQGSTADGGAHMFGTDPGGYLNMLYGWVFQSPQQKPQLNTWNFEVIEGNGSIAYQYVNGTLTNTAANQGTANNVTYLGLDGRGIPGSNWIGYLDDFRYYDRALNTTELNAIYQNYLNTPGYGDLGAAESYSAPAVHNVTFTQPAPNVTFAKGATIGIQENATCSQSDAISYAVNDSRFAVNASGFFANQSIGVNRLFANIRINATDTTAVYAFSDFWVNLTCNPSWICGGYGACNSSNIEPCLNVSDANCGDSFTGGLSQYDQSCNCTPSYSCDSWGLCNASNIAPCLGVTDKSICQRAYNGSLSAYDNESCACVPSYSCVSFGTCGNDSIQPCLSVVDSWCGLAYNGSNSTYNRACINPMGGITAGTTGYYVVFGILSFLWAVFFWLAWDSKQPLFQGVVLVLGVVLAIYARPIHWLLSLMFAAFSVGGLFIKD